MHPVGTECTPLDNYVPQAAYEFYPEPLKNPETLNLTFCENVRFFFKRFPNWTNWLSAMMSGIKKSCWMPYIFIITQITCWELTSDISYACLVLLAGANAV